VSSAQSTSTDAAFLPSDPVSLPQEWNAADVVILSVDSARPAVEGSDYEIVARNVPSPDVMPQPESILPQTLGGDGSYGVLSSWWSPAQSAEFGIEPEEQEARGNDLGFRAPDLDLVTIPWRTPEPTDAKVRSELQAFPQGGPWLGARRGNLLIGVDSAPLGIGAYWWSVFTWDADSDASTTIATWEDICDPEHLPYPGLVEHTVGATSTSVVWSATFGSEIGDRCDEPYRSSTQAAIFSRALDGTGPITVLATGAHIFAVDGDTIYYLRDGQGMGDPLDPQWEIRQIGSSGEDTVVAHGELPPDIVREGEREQLKYGIRVLAADAGTVAWRLAHARTKVTSGAGRDDSRIYVQRPDGRHTIVYEHDHGNASLALSGSRMVWAGSDPNAGAPALPDTGLQDHNDPANYILDLDTEEMVHLSDCGGCGNPSIAGEYLTWQEREDSGVEALGPYLITTLARLTK
jgi:hypothetical protein